MGQEAICKARFENKTSQGKAMLETDYVLFRGDFRVKIPFRAMTAVEAKGAWLEIESSEGSLGLNLGAAAQKWAQKILHPPSRIDKLGVKAGMRVSVLGVTDATFAGEMEERCADVSARFASKADMIFFGAEKKTALDRLVGLSRSIVPEGAIWIVYPKGVREITENDVLSATRAAGLVDTKVVGFSKSHTAIKAVIPVAARKKMAANGRE